MNKCVCILKNKLLIFIVLAFSLSGCSRLLDTDVEWQTVEPNSYPVLHAVGYAPINAQRGNDDTAKTLLAMRASKLDAYRELAEQVYGQKVNGRQSLSNLVLDNAKLQTSVDGVIRGARVVKVYPVGEDTYATELELDMEKVYNIYISSTRPKEVKSVQYF